MTVFTKCYSFENTLFSRNFRVLGEVHDEDFRFLSRQISALWALMSVVSFGVFVFVFFFFFFEGVLDFSDFQIFRDSFEYLCSHF